MATKKPPSEASEPPPELAIFEASISAPGTVFEGGVLKGARLTQQQAEARRKAGMDVVVCGPNLAANRRLAGIIEENANGAWRRCPPHASAGPLALPHYQPKTRPPEGHTFYETPKRFAI